MAKEEEKTYQAGFLPYVITLYSCELPVPGGWTLHNVIAHYSQLLSLFLGMHLGQLSADLQRDKINSNGAAKWNQRHLLHLYPCRGTETGMLFMSRRDLTCQ